MRENGKYHTTIGSALLGIEPNMSNITPPRTVSQCFFTILHLHSIWSPFGEYSGGIVNVHDQGADLCFPGLSYSLRNPNPKAAFTL